MAICTRRRCPSDTRCMRQAGLMSMTSNSIARRAAPTPRTFSSMAPALMSACTGHESFVRAGVAFALRKVHAA